MAKSSIYEKIEQKSRDEADAIIREGQNRAASIKAEKLKEANVDNNKILAKTKQRIDEQLKAAKTQFEQQAKQESLQTKKDLITKALGHALKKLKDLDDETLFNFIVEKLKNEQLEGNELIQVSEQDYNKYLNILSLGKKEGEYYSLDKLNKSLGNSFNLRLDNQYANINGGFIIVGRKFDLNFSFESVLNNFKEENEVEIANILFNKGE